MKLKEVTRTGLSLSDKKIHVYLWLIHADVLQKPSQHCKVIIL